MEWIPQTDSKIHLTIENRAVLQKSKLTDRFKIKFLALLLTKHLPKFKKQAFRNLEINIFVCTNTFIL